MYTSLKTPMTSINDRSIKKKTFSRDKEVHYSKSQLYPKSSLAQHTEHIIIDAWIYVSGYLQKNKKKQTTKPCKK